ncbi:unnamed protein product [Spirodela intermedia]|uniref:Uncharacterized protein n=1 Tax=Spirodela intermedia TaxID=51605 RepID=A0ABN7EBK2_SPIIN|nr:unnamed protein product [Spirodela intermedia]
MACPRWSPCFRKELRCLRSAPTPPRQPRAKLCFLDCYSPNARPPAGVKKRASSSSSVLISRPVYCRRRARLQQQRLGCYDPRFIGGDGVVFYFHGKKDGHYALLSDRSFQVNARFIGLRPAGRTRDATWIQASATGVAVWDSGAADHIRLSYDGAAVELPRGTGLVDLPGGALTVERTGGSTGRRGGGAGDGEDDRIHRYGIPAGDLLCPSGGAVQVAPPVAGDGGGAGEDLQGGFVNPAKRGVEMAVLGGEEEYGVAELLSPRCKLCVFSPEKTAAAAEAE